MTMSETLSAVWQQVMVENEDPQLVRLGFRELLLDPAVAAATNLAVVEVRLGRVDRDHRDSLGRRAKNSARRG